MIVFGSRGSDLALWQTRHIAASLRAATGEDFTIEVIETKGDRVLDQPLPTLGGKGLFTAELETALREGRIDVAVHSMKDLPVEDPEGLTVGAVSARVATADVLVYDPRFADPT
ncbi:MAG: hydroxymethylbilane synthase, partial [Planctomycetes bacterium]|nr:hydroxymethylbilane synthase [Planctomycetota bacterium]